MDPIFLEVFGKVSGTNLQNLLDLGLQFIGAGEKYSLVLSKQDNRRPDEKIGFFFATDNVKNFRNLKGNNWEFEPSKSTQMSNLQTKLPEKGFEIIRKKIFKNSELCLQKCRTLGENCSGSVIRNAFYPSAKKQCGVMFWNYESSLFRTFDEKLWEFKTEIFHGIVKTDEEKATKTVWRNVQ